MATFTITATYTFFADYEVEADTFEQAEEQGYTLMGEWLPYSSEKGYTDDWANSEIDVVHTSGEIVEDDEDE